MKPFGRTDYEDRYEGQNFALTAHKAFGSDAHWANLYLAGIHKDLSREDSEVTYQDGVWVTMNDKEIDELITALQYYRRYGTFKKED